MGRSLLSVLVLALLFSVGQAAVSFHDVWNLVLPHSASPAEKAVPEPTLHEEMRPLPITEAAAGVDPADVDDHDHPKARVDFGTKAWPYVYYARRDREGTVDWGTKSWPYIFYSKREEARGVASSDEAAAAAAAHYGRKLGHGFRL